MALLGLPETFDDTAPWLAAALPPAFRLLGTDASSAADEDQN